LAALFLELTAGAPVLSKAKRDVLPSSRVIGQNAPLQSEEPAPVSARKYNLMRTVYIAAIALATLGWLWLIGWIALQLV
jgi:hypothetical protein